MLDSAKISFGLDTFGDMTVDDAGKPESAAEVIRHIVDQAVLADSLGLNNFNIGEHHRDDFSVSAPDVVLAGIATRTKKIILGTGVTVLSSDDPVRVYQRFATLDALSHGRAEITAGRGSFTESFPLFGYELSDYNVLFEEKVELLVQLLSEGSITWSGTTRAPLTNQQVYPKTEGGPMRMRIGVGGTPESAIRAARLGVPMALAIIGGDPARFAPFAQLYRDSLQHFGRAQLPISIHSPGYIAQSEDEAYEDLWPSYQVMFGRIGRERGWGKPSLDQFIAEATQGSMYAGSPAKIAPRIAYAIKAIGAARFDLKYANGTMPHSKLLKSIELYATEVVPRVQKLLAS
ncbi:MAG: LLM class flavin-dependent oxidoreductase [Actinobacteria bacterium]|nr:LLM class flavin-dependent oxidoreductase [Actinomycetota bacterium]